MILSRARTLIADLPLSSRLVGDGVWALLSRVLIGFFGLVIGGFHTRLLSPNDVGDYAFTLSLVVPAAVLAQLGLGATSIREIASSLSRNAPQAARETVYQTLLWGGVGIIGTGTLFLVFSEQIGVRNDVVSLVLVWIVVMTGTQLLGEMLRGFHDIRGAVLISGSTYGGIVPHFVTVILLILAWLFVGDLNLSQLIGLMLIGGITSVGLGVFFLSKVLPSPTSGENGLHINLRVVRQSLPILVSMITDILWSQAAIWILIIYTSSESLAIYDTARRLVALVSLALTIANVILPPTIAQLYAEGNLERLERLLRRSAAVVGVPAVIGFICIAYFGESILGFVYGEYYRIGERVLIILTLGNTLQVLTGSCGVVLNMTGKQNELMKVMVVGALVTTVGAIIAAPIWGVEGVAIVMAAGMVLQNAAKMLLVKRLIGIWTFVGI